MSSGNKLPFLAAEKFSETIIFLFICGWGKMVGESTMEDRKASFLDAVPTLAPTRKLAYLFIVQKC